MVAGQVRPPKDTEKYRSLLRIEAVNGMDPELAKLRPNFEQLTPIFPNKGFNLNTARACSRSVSWSSLLPLVLDSVV